MEVSKISTKNGYEIINFKSIDPKISIESCDPMIYTGIYYDPLLGKLVTGYWDKYGRTINRKREDCFIDL